MPLINEDKLRQMRGQAANAIRQQAKQPLNEGYRRYTPTPTNEIPDLMKQVKRSAEGELIKRGFDLAAWQRANFKRLGKMEPAPGSFDSGTTSNRTRQRTNSRGPGVGTGRHHINSGRPTKK